MSALAKTALSATLFLGAVAAAHARPAPFDGAWNVLLTVEAGQCNPGDRYGYSILIGGGQVVYQGRAAVDLAGTISPKGHVTVDITQGAEAISGTGTFTSRKGAGTWHARNGIGECRGSWQAVRR